MSILSQNWWLIVLRGLAAIAFGLAAFLWPGLTLLALIALFGIYALVDGLFAIITGLSHTHDSSRWWVFLLEGLLGVGVGLLVLLQPGIATLAFLAMVAAWAILTGILEIAAAIRLRRDISNEWLLALGGCLSLGLGVLLIARPIAGTLAVVWILGAYSLLFGVLLVSLGFRVRSHDLTGDDPRIFVEHGSL